MLLAYLEHSGSCFATLVPKSHYMIYQAKKKKKNQTKKANVCSQCCLCLKNIYILLIISTN